MAKNWIIFFIKLCVTGGLLWWLFSTARLDFSPLVGEFPGPLHLLGIIAIFASIVPQTARWSLLLKLQGIKFKFLKVAQWTVIGEFFGLTLPGGAGTEIARAYYMFRNAPNAKTAAMSSIILDRIFALSSLVFLGVVSFVYLYLTSPEVNQSILYMGGAMSLVLAGVGFGFFVIALKPTRKLLQIMAPEKYADILDNIITAYVSRKGALLQCFLLSLASHLCMLAAFFLAAEILNSDIDWTTMAIVMPLVLISNILPVAPAGIGVGETAASFLFAQFGILNGATVMLVARVWLVLMQLFGGLVYLSHRREKIDDPSRDMDTDFSSSTSHGKQI